MKKTWSTKSHEAVPLSRLHSSSHGSWNHSCSPHKASFTVAVTVNFTWEHDYTALAFGNTAALLFKLRSQLLSLSVRWKSFKKEVLRNCTVNMCTYVHIIQSFSLSRTLYCTVHRKFFFFLTHYFWTIYSIRKTVHGWRISFLEP